MPERVILCIGTKKGLFVAEAREDPAQLRAARAVRTGRGRLRGADRHARHAAPLRLELQRVLRHEGPALDRSRQEVQGDEVGARRSPRTTAGRSPTSGRSSRATARRTSGAASSRRRSSAAATAAIPGRWSPGSATTSTPASGSPGNGGLCMHTILRDGDRVHLGISTGGHYLSEDGGETFAAAQPGRRRRLRARSVSRVRPVRAQDRRPPGRARPALHAEPRRLGRLGRAGGPRPASASCAATTTATPGGRSRKGLPSDFGFPIVVHPHDPDTVYVMPLEPMTRTCPGGAPAVWRSENGGDSWKRLARGLPKKESFFTVLRDAMDIDELKSPALYFGTTTGQLWIGRDGGEEWELPLRLAAADPLREGRGGLRRKPPLADQRVSKVYRAGTTSLEFMSMVRVHPEVPLNSNGAGLGPRR